MRMVTARESARQCVRSTHGGSPGTASVAKNTRAAHSRRGDVPITMDAVLTETLFLDHLDTSTRPHESIAVSRFPQQNIPKRAQGGVQQRVAALEREIAASAGSRSQHPVHASATPIAGSPRSKYIGRTTGGSRLRESSLSYSESKTRMTKQVADSKKKMVTFVSSVENSANVANAVYSMDSFDHVHDRLKDRFGATLAEHELGRACEFLGYPLLSCELDEAKSLLPWSADCQVSIGDVCSWFCNLEKSYSTIGPNLIDDAILDPGDPEKLQHYIRELHSSRTQTEGDIAKLTYMKA